MKKKKIFFIAGLDIIQILKPEEDVLVNRQ